MIVRIRHPKRSEHTVFVPARHDAESDAWIAVSPRFQPCHDEIEAAQACLESVLALWSHVVREARTLRALTEHPNFDFHADGVDADLVRDNARSLAERVEFLSRDLERLLDEPDDADRVQVLGVLEIVDAPLELPGVDAPEVAPETSTPPGESNATSDDRPLAGMHVVSCVDREDE